MKEKPPFTTKPSTPSAAEIPEEAAVQSNAAAARSAEPASTRSVERLFPFVLRARSLILGRETLIRSKGKLHFILITHDLSENSREEVLKDFRHYPVVLRYTSADLEKHFGVRGAKVIGFQKSGLAQSIYAELKEFRINKPVEHVRKPSEKTEARPPKKRRSVPRNSKPDTHSHRETSAAAGLSDGSESDLQG